MRQEATIENTGVDAAPVRSHRFARVVTLAATDSAAVVGAGLAAHLLWTVVVRGEHPWRLAQLVGTVPLFMLAYASAGLYPGHGVTAVQMLRTTFRQTSLVFLAILSTAYVLRLQGPPGRGTLAAWWALAVVTVPLARAGLAWLAASWTWWREPVLLVGDPARLETLAETIARSRHVGYRPVAVCLTSGLAPDRDVWRGLPVLSAADVVATARRLDVSTVLVAAAAGQAERWALELSEHVRRVVSVLSVEEGYVEPMAVRHLGQAVGIELHNRLLVPHNQVAKRAMDVVLAGAGLVLSLPIMAVAALAIVLRDPGPFLHAQPREGRHGRVFRMWKLRTMYCDAEARLVEHLRRDHRARDEWEREFKLTADPRVLPGVGRLLRRWSLDECPQLWNVLRGDMSLVGPRALPAYHLQAFGPAFRARRQRVRPGITGMWQVMSRGRGAIRTQEALDGHYISNWSIWMDIFLLAKTVQAVISGRGAR